MPQEGKTVLFTGNAFCHLFFCQQVDESRPWSVQGESILSFFVVGVQHNLLLSFRANSCAWMFLPCCWCSGEGSCGYGQCVVMPWL